MKKYLIAGLSMAGVALSAMTCLAADYTASSTSLLTDSIGAVTESVYSKFQVGLPLILAVVGAIFSVLLIIALLFRFIKRHAK